MILRHFCSLDNTKYQVAYLSSLELKYGALKLILNIIFKQNKINMNAKAVKPKIKSKIELFRIILNKLLPSQGNVGKVPHVYFWKKADSPRNFSGKFLKIVGILLWIIVLLNLIIIFLIYKIIF